jgi:hypothetical protein
MTRRLALAGAFAAAVAAGALFTPTANAGNVAWSVSVGVPGVAVTAGAPYWGYRPYHRHYRPYYRAYAPVVYPAPYVAPYAYVAPAPVVVRPPVYVAPRPVYYGY